MRHLQPDLFDPGRLVPVYAPRARRTDPETAHAAAAAVRPKAANLEAIVLEALAKYRAGLTSLELADVTGLSRVSVSPVLRPLERAGLVVEAGKRKGRTGAAGIVWKLREAAHSATTQGDAA